MLPRLCFLLLLVAACAAEEGVRDDAPRHPIDKADLLGTCVGTDCDGPSLQGNCFCDEICSFYGDCCADKAEVCEDAPPTCESLGGQCKLHSPEGCGDDGEPADGSCEI